MDHVFCHDFSVSFCVGKKHRTFSGKCKNKGMIFTYSEVHLHYPSTVKGSYKLNAKTPECNWLSNPVWLLWVAYEGTQNAGKLKM